ncbi:MAG TPA: protein kinase, partial [Pyrinomonadaceae bacterium]|nr:protein kinase [Pyrinomonadaceae bacterium]
MPGPLESDKQAEALLEAALKLDLAERASFLDRACSGNVELRQQVEAALAARNVRMPRTDQSVAQTESQVDAELTAGSLIAHYKILSFIGRGGMGDVYLAHDTRLGRKVALKLLPKLLSMDQERLPRFRREARSASALTHPNVCVIHEIGETDDGRPYIAMEYIEGETLRQRLEHRRLKVSEAIDIARQTASALAAAHSAGVVHRDVKPENIMIRRDGYVKVLDFGLAKLTERYETGSDSEAPTFHAFSTHTGALLGTTYYLSPEQARRAEVDERADIWALGVVLYETIAGRFPFSGETPSHVVVSILETDPAPLTNFANNIPLELEWIVKKALRKDREQRYQTMNEFLGDLDDIRFSESSPGETRAITSGPAPASVRNSSALESFSQSLRRPRLSIVSVIIVALFVGVIMWVIVQKVRNRSAHPFQNLELIKLTNSGNVTDAAISPDGKYVAYVVDELGKQSLWAKHVPTASNVMIAAPDAVRYQGLTFSNDGNYIYYVRQEKEQVGALYEVPVVGGVSKRLLDNIGSAVTLSPDGKRLAFIREEPVIKLMISNADGT